jgi:phosphatidylserine/phosphatidylglycerophosphate/cardiolipin synthase-like enzyme
MPASGVELLVGEALHDRVIRDSVLGARRFVWIATANLKDMRLKDGRRYRPILEVFDRMAESGVKFRLVHSDLPSRAFRETLERLPRLVERSLELQVCPRSHWKMVIVDGREAYWGSANFTGAGLGAKGGHRRNLEMGMFSRDAEWVGRIQSLFDDFWMGNYCPRCAVRARCPDPISD